MEKCRNGKLLFVCGKMAAGKSTLSKELAAREEAVLLTQDDMLVALYPDEIVDLRAFVKYSTRIQDAPAPHICSLLSMGVSVVLDFPANTRKQRAWFRQLLDRADADHELHFIAVSDELCRRQLKAIRQPQKRTSMSFATNGALDSARGAARPGPAIALQPVCRLKADVTAF
jgi:predicted kinase